MSQLKELETNDDLAALFDRSFREPVFFFKHSLTCGISSIVLDDVRELDADIHVIVVQRSRSLSNEVESKLGVRHESPQAIVVSKGRAVYAASHYEISGDEIAAILNGDVNEG
ncbi:MAG TPA: bacillithiol system redox-active protein YtxJ [Pyrinomonadaceae bacterium]|nr:bacillithiol system redox-active protein YtxJ [Pyrinomonadaceae bacterium]